jgi:hypothetical protein
MAYTSFVDGGALPFAGVPWWPRKPRLGLLGAALIGAGAVLAALPLAALGTASVAVVSLAANGYQRGPAVHQPFGPARRDTRLVSAALPRQAMILAAAATPEDAVLKPSATPMVTREEGASPVRLALAAPPLPAEIADAGSVPAVAEDAQAAPPPPAVPETVLALAPATEPDVRQEAIQQAIPLPPALSRPTPTPRGATVQGEGATRAPARRMLASLPPDSGPLAPTPAPEATMLPGPGSRFALYDIEGHTVYMPNGERLEAHSGLGEHFDDPDSITRKNRGVTPPNTYDLRMRESLFHGVAAIRLTPVSGSQMFGRDGMLAHTYMLGPRGDSNGCVSFKDYSKFLNAFRRGEVSRLVVVKRLDSASARVASARTGKRFLWWNL